MSTPYDLASSLMGGAAGGYGDAANLFGGVAGQAADVFGAMPTNIQQERTTAGTYGPGDLNSALYGNMNAYLDPYYNDVLNAALGDMAEQRDLTLQSVGDQATAAGAFGGSRHGLVEGQVHRGYVDDAGQLAAQLRSQGWQNALNTGMNVLNADLNRGQFLTGLQFQGDLATNQNNAQLALNQGLGAGQLALSGAGGLGNTAAGAANLGGQYYNVGNNIADRQGAAGTTQQQLLQAILSQGDQTFQGYLDDPYRAMDLMSALLTSDPRSGNITTSGTNTQGSTPGILDYLSLAAQTAGSIFGA